MSYVQKRSGLMSFTRVNIEPKLVLPNQNPRFELVENGNFWGNFERKELLVLVLNDALPKGQ